MVFWANAMDVAVGVQVVFGIDGLDHDPQPLLCSILSDFSFAQSPPRPHDRHPACSAQQEHPRCHEVSNWNQWVVQCDRRDAHRVLRPFFHELGVGDWIVVTGNRVDTVLPSSLRVRSVLPAITIFGRVI